MGISYKLEHFEGPLDLLLHLIEKNKVSIYDIPIVTITEQYLDYVNHMDIQDLDLVSEFLVMAATLLDIKARMLLPREEKEEEEEEDPRAELVRRLLEYKMYKFMARELEDMEEDAERLLLKRLRFPGRWRSTRRLWIWTSF
ncbi:MAG: segregation and condensation protein A [Clostridium sp.]